MHLMPESKRIISICVPCIKCRGIGYLSIVSNIWSSTRESLSLKRSINSKLPGWGDRNPFGEHACRCRCRRGPLASPVPAPRSHKVSIFPDHGSAGFGSARQAGSTTVPIKPNTKSDLSFTSKAIQSKMMEISKNFQVMNLITRTACHYIA